MPYFNTTAAWCGQAVPLFPAGHVQIPVEQSLLRPSNTHGRNKH